MLIYIAGPFSSDDIWVTKKFNEIEKQLTARGHEVVSPLKICLPIDDGTISRYSDYINRETADTEWVIKAIYDLYFIAKCDALYLMNNWEEYEEAIIAFAVAHRLGLRIIFEPAVFNKQRTKEWFEGQF